MVLLSLGKILLQHELNENSFMQLILSSVPAADQAMLFIRQVNHAHAGSSNLLPSMPLKLGHDAHRFLESSSCSSFHTTGSTGPTYTASVWLLVWHQMTALPLCPPPFSTLS